MKQVYDIHPHKIYVANIDKDESFHLETLNESIRTMNFFVGDIRTGKDDYTSEQKNYWINSTTYSREFNNPAFKEIFDFIDKCANEYLKEFCVDTNVYQIKMTSSYLNKCTKGQSYHNHTGAFISYSYYFYLDGTVSPIIFGNPVQSDSTYFPFNLCTTRVEAEFYPVAGDTMFFPSYIQHRVPDLEATTNRVYDGTRWLLNGDYHIFSDAHPNLPNRIL
jgi:hypothetical protein